MTGPSRLLKFGDKIDAFLHPKHILNGKCNSFIDCPLALSITDSLIMKGVRICRRHVETGEIRVTLTDKCRAVLHIANRSLAKVPFRVDTIGDDAAVEKKQALIAELGLGDGKLYRGGYQVVEVKPPVKPKTPAQKEKAREAYYDRKLNGKKEGRGRSRQYGN